MAIGGSMKMEKRKQLIKQDDKEPLASLNLLNNIVLLFLNLMRPEECFTIFWTIFIYLLEC